MIRTKLATYTRATLGPGAVRTMATRVPIVGGNWKCNAGGGVTVADVDALVTGLNAAADPKCETFIAPPSLYLMKVKEMAKPSLNVCAQVSTDARALFLCTVHGGCHTLWLPHQSVCAPSDACSTCAFF